MQTRAWVPLGVECIRAVYFFPVDVLSTITNTNVFFVFRMVALRRMFDPDADNNFVAQVVELAVLDEQNYNDADIMVSVGKQLNWYVKLVFIIHVGGTRCVPSSTDNIMKRQARITLTVEFIRTCIFKFLFYV